MPLTDKLSAIGEAIRAKTGKSDKLTLDQMPGEIASITGSGGSVAGCVTVTFMNGNTELFSRPVYIGDDCPDPLEQGHIKNTPTKASTAQYYYTYLGWGNASGAFDANILKNIREDKTVYATFSATLQTYTIKFVDDDGSVFKDETLTYGSTPVAPTVKKDGYAFEGWSPDVATVTADVIYTAVWSVSEFVASGECGDGVTWGYKNDGTLIISGTGPMTASLAGSWPWLSYRDQIAKIKVEEGVTSISASAFHSCTNAKSVSLPNSLESIGMAAFYNTGIESCTIPYGVTVIPSSTFSGCTSLASIEIPSSVISIEGSAFSGCAFTSVVIPNSVTSIANYAFTKCSKLESIVISDGVASMESSVVDQCTALKSITIGSGMTFLWCGGFYANTNLTSAIFKVTTGWKRAETSTSTRYSVNVSDPSTAASYMKSSKNDKRNYWYRE